MENKYDTLVIELQNEGKSVGSISIRKTDLDTLIKSHGQTRAAILEDMVETIEKANKDSVQQENKIDLQN
jgi:hypothetical protein